MKGVEGMDWPTPGKSTSQPAGLHVPVLGSKSSNFVVTFVAPVENLLISADSLHVASVQLAAPKPARHGKRVTGKNKQKRPTPGGHRAHSGGLVSPTTRMHQTGRVEQGASNGCFVPIGGDTQLASALGAAVELHRVIHHVRQLHQQHVTFAF